MFHHGNAPATQVSWDELTASAATVSLCMFSTYTVDLFVVFFSNLFKNMADECIGLACWTAVSPHCKWLSVISLSAGLPRPIYTAQITVSHICCSRTAQVNMTQIGSKMQNNSEDLSAVGYKNSTQRNKEDIKWQMWLLSAFESRFSYSFSELSSSFAISLLYTKLTVSFLQAKK